MLKSLVFDCDPIDQPAATDPIERLTWCSMRVRVGQRIVSRIWDDALQNERTNLYLPAFPIAQWIVENWWSLLNELCSWEVAPTEPRDAAQAQWIKRHCLRAADASLLLPALYIFHDGRAIRAEWNSDRQDSLANMPGEFITDGVAELEENATRESFATFVNWTLDRVVALKDERVAELAAHWSAIQDAQADERLFCELAGRMGIDPYDPQTMTDELAQFLESSLGDAVEPLARDLTEVAQPDSVIAQWQWIKRQSDDVHLGANPGIASDAGPDPGTAPYEFGYRLARQLRVASDFPPTSKLDSIDSFAEPFLGRALRFEERNHIPGRGIRAIVGRSMDDVVIVGPRPQYSDKERFLKARGLYHALITTKHSPRLITQAYSWEQKASRAFAAELLAPQKALLARLSATGTDAEAIESLGSEFDVSAWVIEKQLENSGVALAGD